METKNKDRLRSPGIISGKLITACTDSYRWEHICRSEESYSNPVSDNYACTWCPSLQDTANTCNPPDIIVSGSLTMGQIAAISTGGTVVAGGLFIILVIFVFLPLGIVSVGV